ncbi:MAG: Do family serine endopeptidase [Spirochaetales bacterium]|nr:Do family serine endopeptidase [Spirochaetales bacterium]
MKITTSARHALAFVLIAVSILVSIFSVITSRGAYRNSDFFEQVFAQSVRNTDYEKALALQNVYRQVAADVLPVVVEIDAVEFQDSETSDTFNPFRFFMEPKDDIYSDDGDSKRYRSEGLGSGILVRRDSDRYYVLTNNHVAGNADEITIKLFDERSYDGNIVGTDERKDLALVSFETSEDLKIGILGDSDDLYVGDFVLAVGNPFGFQSTVTSGIISALGRKQGPENISDFIQTDASINQGNSGGALVNLKGEIIGVNTWITTPTGGSIGLGFSIPINNAKKAIDDIIRSGSPQYGWLGVSINSINEETGISLGIKSESGAFIGQVFRNSPADKSGILPGDYITSVNGRTLKSGDDLFYLIGDIQPGSEVQFFVERDGNQIAISVLIEKRDDEKAAQLLSSSYLAWPGALVAPLNDELRKALSLDDNENGVVVYEIYPKTPMQISGIKKGDRITEINNAAIADLREFYRQINSNKEITITYIREGDSFETSLIKIR